MKAKRNEDSRLCKKAKYKFDAEYRAAEIIRCHKRRELVTELSVTPLQWLEIVAQFNGVCAYCGSPHNLTMDHVVPISKGGKLPLIMLYQRVPGATPVSKLMMLLSGTQNSYFILKTD